MSLVQRWSAVMMDNYGTPPIALVRGQGARVWDDSGREYVDFLAGIAVNALGHAHPAVVQAIVQQAQVLGHTSNLAVTAPAVALAERLLSLTEADGRVFFCNSGAEANEAAFKLARLTGRPTVIAASGAFHGRTMGALAMTGQPAKQEPFRPLPGDVRFVPYGDATALAEAADATVAAVVLEPIQGEGGVVPAPAGYLRAAREVCDRTGALLILDEVQTGVGRTGAWFAYQHEGVRPDAITLAKGLGGGLPIGALIAFGDAGRLFTPGSHGSTFGGNPVCAAAALAVLDEIKREDLLDRASQLSSRITAYVEGLRSPLISHVRGRGLLLGIVLTADRARGIEARARECGLLVNACAPDVIRLAPPLVITDEDVERFESAFSSALADES